MKKVLSVIAVLLCLTLVFSSCTKEKDVSTEKAVINIGLLKGPTGMGAAKLLKDDADGTAKADYNLTLAGDPNVLTAALINGELDIAALPTNGAATLNAKTNGKVQILAVNTLGVIYLMSNTDTIKTVADLEGKTILSAGKGTNTEYVLNYILSENSVNAEIEFAAEHAEVITKAKAGGYDVILLPEPFVTQMKAQDAGFSVCIDLTKEWKTLGAGELTMGCIAVRTEFAQNNPDAVTSFIEDYTASVKFINNTPEEAGKIIEEFDIAKAVIASKAIPNCNIVVITGEEMKTAVSAYLTVLHTADAGSVGGKLPGDDFYYSAK